MGIQTCCVGNCCSTSETHRLFCFPKKEQLCMLWMHFIVPTNPRLIGLTCQQLLTKRVCEKHFDHTQFDGEGKRLRYSYPCLFTEMEIAHGVPLAAPDSEAADHTYCKKIKKSYSKDEVLKSHAESDAVVPDLVTKSTDPLQSDSDPSTHTDLVTESADPLQLDSGPTTHTVSKLGSIQRNYVAQIKNIATATLGVSALNRLSKAQAFLQNGSMLENFNLMSKQAQTFLLMQVKQASNKKMARRFTIEEKLLALLLMKESPKGYKLLQNMFVLPNKRTLNRLSEKITLNPGLNDKILIHIKNKINKWNTKEKLCTIVFDEVALTQHINFNEKNDVINDIVDSENTRNMRCDHALIFMVRGICASWRQSIAFHFYVGTVPAVKLIQILENIVTHVADTGLIPLGLVCDQGSTFRTAIKYLRENSIRARNIKNVRDDGSVYIGGHDLSIFFDPPHLLKELRNNFLTRDVKWEGKTASWKDIEYIFDLDSKLKTRALPKITAHHIDPKLMGKKVSIAAQVLSRTAAMLRYTNAVNNLNKRQTDTSNQATMETTADFVEFCDKLFDSVNGCPQRRLKKGKLRRAVNKNSEHHSFWIEAIRKIKKITFINKITLTAEETRDVRVPTLQGWIITLESFGRLSKILFKKYKVDSFYPRNINLDPLENYFVRIRY